MQEEIFKLVFNDSEDKEVLEKWIDTYLPQLKAGIDLSGSSRFKDALKKGVPVEVRGEVWTAFIGNAFRVNKNMYDGLLKRVRLSQNHISQDE